jgi:hypothetical protein
MFIASVKKYRARWWLMVKILATWEVKIQRTVVKASLGKKLVKPYLNKKAGHGGMHLPSQLGGRHE